MRPTIRIIPKTYYLLNKTKVPSSVIVNPFADPVGGMNEKGEMNNK